MSLSANESTVCVLPWCHLHIWAKQTTFCCHLPGAVRRYPFMEGPYLGEDVWNGPQERRARMEWADRPEPCSACRQVNCFQHQNTLTVADQISFLRRYLPGDDARWNAVEAASLSGSPEAPPLAYIRLHIGNFCDSDCPMCGQRDEEHSTSKITPAQIKGVSRACADALRITLTGGDLFANPDEQVGRLLDLGTDRTIMETITNGRGMSLSRYEAACEQGRLKHVNVSLHTVDPEMYRKQCGRDIAPVLRNLRDIGQAYGADSRVRSYYVVVTDWTLDGLPDVVRFATETGVPDVMIAPYVGNALALHGFPEADIRGPHARADVPERIARVTEQLDALRDESHVRITGWDMFRKLAG